MVQVIDHVCGLANFAEPSQARRIRALSKKKGGLRDLAILLKHKYVPQKKYQIDCCQLEFDDVLQKLRALGAPKTALAFGWLEPEGKIGPLEEALGMALGNRSGQVASCIPGVLAFFEPEELGERMILYRRT